MRLWKIFLLAISVLIVDVASATAQGSLKNSFRVDVTVTGLKKPATIFLIVRETEQWKEYSVPSNDGKFVITGSLVEPTFAYVVLKYANEITRQPRMNNISQLFLSFAPAQVTAKDSLTSATITGGHLQDEFKELNKALIGCMYPGCEIDEKFKIVRDFITKHPSSFVSLFAIQNFSLDNTFRLDPERSESLFQLISPSLKKTLSGQEIAKAIETTKRTSIGAIAADFTQKDTLGQDVALKSFRGKYVLVDFWASWCGPCRAENPNVVSAFAKFRDKNFTILSVSLDKNKGSWTKAIRDDKLVWTHVSDLKYWSNEVAILYGVKAVPQNFLLDPNGKIIARNLRAQQLEEVLGNLIP